MSNSLVGRSLGSYVVEHELASGGMGNVWLARQVSLDRPAVLKRIRRDLLEYPELAERFAREARTAARIHHPNVVAVYDTFAFRNDQYIAQEFVDGVDLSAALDKTGPLPWRIAGLVALEVARGLEEIHAHGTIHRDLKPANILLGRRGEVKIADFGLAREAGGGSLTEPGVAIGSPAYMPPEQMRGERVDARGDLFSLAVILFEMLAGVLPYPNRFRPPDQAESTVCADGEAEPSESLLARMEKERHPKLRRLAPATPRRLERLVRRGLRARATNRPASAQALRQQLEALLGTPSPADVRSEIASWLWSNAVFEWREHETLVQLASAGRRSARRVWVAALAVTLAALAAAASFVVDVRPRWPAPFGAASALESEPARAPAYRPLP